MFEVVRRDGYHDESRRVGVGKQARTSNRGRLCECRPQNNGLGDGAGPSRRRTASSRPCEEAPA